MAYPRLHDDGITVTLDLHGAAVHDAVALAQATVHEAARRGRHSVKLIHGSSTSRRQYANRTIKHALHDLLDAGALASFVYSSLRAEDYLTVSLSVTTPPDPAPIRLLDVQP